MHVDCRNKSTNILFCNYKMSFMPLSGSSGPTLVAPLSRFDIRVFYPKGMCSDSKF